MSLVRLSPLQACLTFLSTSFVSIFIEWAKENFNENNETMKYLFIYFSYTTMCNFINVMFLYMKKTLCHFLYTGCLQNSLPFLVGIQK